MLELEQREIELKLEEISLKRRQVEIEREKLNNKQNVSVEEHRVSEKSTSMYLHYSNSVQENHMKIADVCPDGSVLIHHGKKSVTISKKYSLRTFYWIKQMLPSWSYKQREESNFWRKLAVKYSKRFLKDDTISHVTMEKLCYLVDSGEVDVWFEKYNSLKGKGRQVQLDGEWVRRRL